MGGKSADCSLSGFDVTAAIVQCKRVSSAHDACFWRERQHHILRTLSPSKQLCQHNEDNHAMASQGFIYGVAAAITFGIQVLGFAVAVALRTEVFYDVRFFTDVVVSLFPFPYVMNLNLTILLSHYTCRERFLVVQITSSWHHFPYRAAAVRRTTHVKY